MRTNEPRRNGIAAVVAFSVALLIAGVLVPFEQYAHYIAWSRKGAFLGCLGYLLAGGAAGLVGYVIGPRLGIEPDNTIARGAVWGGLGAAIVRTQFNRMPKPQGIGEAISLASAASNWALGAVEWTVKRSAEHRLSELGDPELAQYVSDMYESGLRADKEAAEPIKKSSMRELERAIRMLNDPNADETDVQRARSHLRQAGGVWIIKYQFGPPQLRRR